MGQQGVRDASAPAGIPLCLQFYQTEVHLDNASLQRAAYFAEIWSKNSTFALG